MPRRRGRPPLSPLRRNLRTSSIILLLVPLLLATAGVAVAAAAAAAGAEGAAAAGGEGPASSARMLRRGLSSPAPRAALALARHCGFLGPGGPGAGAAAATRRIHFPTSGRRAYAAAAEGSDDAGAAPATTTTTTTRRRAKPSREFIGVAKGMDVGRFRAYSADGFVKAASGLPPALASASAPTASPDGPPLFTVLGIETSCDDTGVAVVRSDGAVLGEALASQHQIHEQWGGVVPGLARDAHAAVIDAMVGEALRKAGMASAAEVDAVGVTVGPGLEICLRVGCETGKALAAAHGKPFVCVHHLEAHCLMARMGAPPPSPVPMPPFEQQAAADSSAPVEALAAFPFLALLVSGGHCMILECRGVGRNRILGGTLDDALGEAYDKAARLLRIGTGAAGGPAMEALARQGNPQAVPLPVPMKQKKDLNFSYAGLKNAFRMAVAKVREQRGLPEEADLAPEDKADLAASFQHVAIQHLEERLERAMRLCDSPPAASDQEEGPLPQKPITTLAVVGGVAANQAIRARLAALCEKRSAALAAEAEAEAMGGDAAGEAGEQQQAPSPPAWRLVVPPPRLCTDNGVMVAWAAIEKLRLGFSDVIEGQDVYARWPFANLHGGAAKASSSS